MPKRPLVLVEWIDPHSTDNNWKPIEDICESTDPLHCRSVGWIVKRAKGCITLVPHISGEANGNIVQNGFGELTLPRRVIRKITVLRRG